MIALSKSLLVLVSVCWASSLVTAYGMLTICEGANRGVKLVHIVAFAAGGAVRFLKVSNSRLTIHVLTVILRKQLPPLFRGPTVLCRPRPST